VQDDDRDRELLLGRAGRHGEPGHVIVMNLLPTPAEALIAAVDKDAWLLARRSLDDGELAYYICYGPAGTTLAELAGVAGTRWMVECCFSARQGRGRAGPRRGPPSRRPVPPHHLGDVGAHVPGGHARRGSRTRRAGERAEVADPPAGLSVPEIRRLLCLLVWPATTAPVLVLAWSWWRRRHQARARRFYWRTRTQKVRL